MVICALTAGLLWALLAGSDKRTVPTGKEFPPAVERPEPARPIAQMGSHRFYHGPLLARAILSPGGKRAASIAEYGGIWVWRRLTDVEIAKYERTIVLWDTSTGNRLHELEIPGRKCWSFAFSPDSKLFAVGCGFPNENSAVAVYDVEGGKLLRMLDEFGGQVIKHVQFSMDGKHLHVTAGRGIITAWDATSGKHLHRWKPPDAGAVDGLLSPDERSIIWEVGPAPVPYAMPPKAPPLPGRPGEHGESPSPPELSLCVHDAATQSLIYRKRLATEPLWFVFSADAKRWAAKSNNITVFETAAGKELGSYRAGPSQTAGLSPDLRLAVIGSVNSRWNVWELNAESALLELSPSVQFYEFWMTASAFSADGTTLLLSTASTLRLFDASTGKERMPPDHRGPITPRYSADGRTLFTLCPEMRCCWDISSAKEPALRSQELRQSSRPFHTVGLWPEYSADHRLFLDWCGNRFGVCQTATGNLVCELKELDGWRPTFGLFSPDSTRILLGCFTGTSATPMRLYDARTGKRTDQVELPPRIEPAVFSRDGRYLAWANLDQDVQIHDAETGKLVHLLQSSRPLARRDCTEAIVLFSGDGEYLVVATSSLDEAIDTLEWTMLPTRVFHVPSGKEIRRFDCNPDTKDKTCGKLTCWACSPDGRLLAVAERESGTIRLIEIASGKVRAELAAHREGVHGLDFSPDGRTLASGGEDNVVFLWDVIVGGSGKTPKEVSREQLAAWWEELADDDAKRAGAALASLIRAGDQAATLLTDRLRAAEPFDDERRRRLNRDLDSESFEVRQTASRELAGFGDRAEAALRNKLVEEPSLELTRRLEALLEKIEQFTLAPQTLQSLRAMEVLERVGTPQATRCLEVMASGAAEATETREAKSALKRLGKRQ